jgi:type IV pilus biogenesis protein PilP
MADNLQKLSLSKMGPKQIVMGLLTVGIVIFIIYEVIGLMGNGGTTATIPAAPTTTTVVTNKTMSSNSATPVVVATGQMDASQLPPRPVSVLAPNKLPDALKDQDEQQKNYLRSLNQLQLLKIERDIAETNQSIYSARLATETAKKNMLDVITQPNPPTGKSNGPNSQLGENSLEALQPTPIMVKVAPEVPITVISVAMRFNRWNAVLQYQNKLLSVSLGDTLADGSRVVSINTRGVTLIKEGKPRRLSMVFF